MAKQITYFSIRAVKAKNKDEAWSKVYDGADFDESNDLCDKILTTQELIEQLLLQLEDENKKKKVKSK